MIRFKYKPNDGIYKLIMKTCPDASVSGYIYGILPEESRYQLKTLSAYLVCSTEEINGARIYKDPTVVIAKNDYEAVTTFADDTNKAGSVMCVLENMANKLKVTPI